MADASFAGQQDSFLNVKGNKQLLDSIKKCFSSLFTARAIYYRHKKGFSPTESKLAIVIQKMINSDKSGVMFSKNPVSAENEIMIEAVFGLGEGIVSGMIKPDNYLISPDPLNFKLLSTKLADKKIAIVRDSSGHNQTVKLNEEMSKREVLSSYELKILASYAKKLEEHYKKPQDIEFAISGRDIYIVQSRPITTKFVEKVDTKLEGDAILSGLGASPGVASGPVKIVYTLADLQKIRKGDVLVTEMTNPDMVVDMQKACGIITDEGGITSHASIVSREMGIPCFGGETIILTDKGFMNLKEINEGISQGKELSTLSFNLKSLKVEWKKVLNSSRRKSETITISVSKNGKIDWNTLTTTKEHKFFTIQENRPNYKEISKILEEDKIIYIARKIPIINKEFSNFEDNKAYLSGAIFSDGYLRIQKDGTSSTVFVQKPAPHKLAFINEVKKVFEETYNYPLREVNKDYNYCYNKRITSELLNIYSEIDNIMLSCPAQSIIKYFSSVIDGDGNYIGRGKVIKVSIDAKDTKLMNSLIIGCLRLGLNYRLRKENNEFRFYIASGLDKIEQHLKRVVVGNQEKVTGDTYFSSKHLFSDITVPGRKGIKTYSKNNLLISEKEIIEKVIPFQTSYAKEWLFTLVNSDMGVLRVKKISDNKIDDVYNIEVEDNNNYVVFTKFLTPIIVKNCVVGTSTATKLLKDGQIITVDGFSGKVYEGKGQEKKVEIKKIIGTKTKIKVIVDLPDYAERAAISGSDSVGLVRLEGIIAESGAHPYYFVKENKLNDYVSVLVKGLSSIAEHFKEIWIRTSDIRTDEYRNLKGAPKEVEGNPMLGNHGVRFSLKHRDIMKSEILAIKQLSEKYKDKVFGIMVPQVISLEELKQTKEIAKELGIERKKSNIKIGIMEETPAAVQIINSLCEEGLDFISFGTNDLTQYILAIDRNNQDIQDLYNEMNPAVLSAISYVIRRCKKAGVETSICGQAASKPEMAKFLVSEGIDSVSVNADAAYTISQTIYEIESQGKLQSLVTSPINAIKNFMKGKDNKEKKESTLEMQSNTLISQDIGKSLDLMDSYSGITKSEDIENLILKELEGSQQEDNHEAQDYSPGNSGSKNKKEIPPLNDAILVDSEHFVDDKEKI